MHFDSSVTCHHKLKSTSRYREIEMDVTFTSDDGIGNDRDVRCEAIIHMNESINRTNHSFYLGVPVFLFELFVRTIG